MKIETLKNKKQRDELNFGGFRLKNKKKNHL